MTGTDFLVDFLFVLGVIALGFLAFVGARSLRSEPDSDTAPRPEEPDIRHGAQR